VPVLLEACIEAMNIHPDGTYVDVTFGGGGHSKEIIKHLSEQGHLYGFDQDADAEQNIPQDEARFTFVRSNFRYLDNWMRYHEVEGIDALLADLGVSSHHFDAEERGFSFRFDASLDMRMNGRGGITAADVLNKYSEEQLANIFYLYGELKNARTLFLMANAQRKAPIVKKILKEAPTDKVPASLLTDHQNSCFYLDEEAASLLK
jgi:16S rRNA (cytosine1402-N4)-methyltransferase